MQWAAATLTPQAADFIRARRPETYPQLILIGKHRGIVELLGMGQIKGTYTFKRPLEILYCLLLFNLNIISSGDLQYLPTN